MWTSLKEKLNEQKVNNYVLLLFFIILLLFKSLFFIRVEWCVWTNFDIFACSAEHQTISFLGEANQVN